MEVTLSRTIFGRSYAIKDKGPLFSPCAPHDVLTRLGDKWTILIVSLLSLAPDHRLRFSEIKRGVDGISQRMLTVTLKNLERDGLLVRHYFAEVPPRVEYELSAMGKSMLPALEGFTAWIRENWPTIEQSRQEFDSRSRSES
ncbi:helix-turn-helix domain-containing protein [Paraburkholderia xenovorans]|uniref:winged helix-turn-helix transcriptional regulator n=1 Tax=Paraburkholderia xenovorans TaxID=36873 RepID=UPI0038B708CD